MNEEIVNLVKKQLEEIFDDYPHTTDIFELEQELKSDLISSAEDKIKEGKTVKVAVDESFNDFGDIPELIDEVIQDNSEDIDEGHHIDINQSGVTIDGGDKLRIDKNGVFINKGKSFRADGSGVSINNGKLFRADENGVKVGNMKIDGRGINFDQNKSKVSDTFSKFDQDFDYNVDTEIYVETLNLVNEKSFEISDINRLDVAYGHASLRILPNSGDKIILREYMSRNNSDYFAGTKVENNTLKINQGRYPKFLHLRIRTQILIPKNFLGDIRVSNVSGNLYINGVSNLGTVKATVNSGSGYFNNISAKNFSAKAKSGRLKVENVKASGALQLLAHSGSVRLNNVFGGAFEIKAHSGAIRGELLSGSGTIEDHSGAISLSVSEITGDLNVESHSGSVKIDMLKNNYKFDLQAKSGTVRPPEASILSHDTSNFKDGFIGEKPVYTVVAKADSGVVKLY